MVADSQAHTLPVGSCSFYQEQEHLEFCNFKHLERNVSVHKARINLAAIAFGLQSM